MKLGKLLGVGKSFFGSDPLAAYQLNKRACLPKFNEGKNPFSLKGDGSAVGTGAATAAVMAAAPAPVAPKAPGAESKVSQGTGLTIAQAVAMAQKARLQKTPPPYAFKPLAKPKVQPSVQPAAKLAANAPAAQPAAKAGRAGWTTRLNPFRPPEPAAPPMAEQTELSLNTVKVVHNDLADADVEIVPVKSHAEPAVGVLPPARQAWEYLGENLLKSS